MGMFEALRAIGYVSDGTPFAVQRRGLDTFVTVSIGKAWQILNCTKLSVVFVGPQLEKSIRALASLADFTYAATGCNIAVFERAHQVSVWRAHSEKVNVLLELGQFIMSIDVKGLVCVWDASKTRTEDPLPASQFSLGPSFTPTCAVHPETYIDKVLVGSEEGGLQLWNIKSKKMIYEFKGWDSPIRACVSAPAIDVVAVGCGDGKIYVHNIRFDETITTFTHATRGSVTALSFRTDGQPLLAAGGSSGVITIWNLEKRKLQTVIKDAHDAAISSLHFLANEPVLLSNSRDNSLKMWIFDTLDGEARLLRYRSGHSAPPTCIRHYGEGRCILSAGQDRAFRIFAAFQDQQSRELSQGHVSKRAKKLHMKEEDIKLPAIVSFDAAEIRARDWCNVVTCHLDHCAAYTWRLQNYVIGEHVLKPCPDKPSPVTACVLSACGNFAVLGTASGVIERFNIQSGAQRGSYADASGLGAHTGAVCGIAADSTNSCLFSAGYDGLIKIWNFKLQSLKASIGTGVPIMKMTYHRGNGLAAVATDDLIIRMYDLVAVRLVRQFEGHTDRVTDITFSEDGKWLLTSSMDATVRIWDVIAAKPVDAMQVSAAVTALSLSPSMDILATCHVNRNGIYLWGNRAMYGGDYETSGAVAVDTALPLAEEDTARVSEEQQDEARSTCQLSPELITLGLLPKSQWQGLVHLDMVKLRNKPIAPPKKPEQAPFFLPTLPSLKGTPVFATGEETANVGTEATSSAILSVMKKSSGGLNSEFMQLVHRFAEHGQWLELLEYIKGMQPSSLDAELRILQVVDEEEDSATVGESLKAIGVLLDFVSELTCSNKDFELVQALLQLLLKIHGESISHHAFLRQKAKSLGEQHAASWRRLDSLFQNARCAISFLSNRSF